MPENPEEKDKSLITRRSFITKATAAIGLVGVGFAAVPFIRSMSPTKDLLAAGVLEADISGIKEGELRTIIWRKQPVFILKRTPEMVQKAAAIDPKTLSDPATTEQRTIRPDLLVTIGICTHLGCVPKFRPEGVPDSDQPGFYCPCHGGKYDSLGRRLGGPPPENLHLVPYRVQDETKLLIGTETFPGYGANIRTIEKLPKI